MPSLNHINNRKHMMKHPSQGDFKKVLCVCSGGLLRSPTVAWVLSNPPFTLYAMDQIVNNAAKWHSMYGANSGSVPLVIRTIIGRGWGQGNQHSQNLTGLFATIPGLKVVCPSNAREAKGLLRSAVKDPNPVIFIEHRWLHNTTSEIPDEKYEYPIGKASTVRLGSDITIVAWSYMVIEALKAAARLKEIGIDVEVIDLGTVRPMDKETIAKSVQKTGRLLVLDESWSFNGLAGEIIASICEDPYIEMKTHPRRICLPDYYSPSTPYLTRDFYHSTSGIVHKVFSMMCRADEGARNLYANILEAENMVHHDIPDTSFKGPF